LWLQARDVAAEHDPDGVRIVLVEVPEQHPLRHDNRAADALPDA